MWKRRAQKVGMPRKEEKKKGRSGTTAKGMGEGKRAQWSERATPKRSSDVYRGVDDIQRSGIICGV